MSKLLFHFLGTGSSYPTKERQNLSVLLEFNSKLILIDTSGTPVQSIIKANCDVNRLTDILISHTHVDHIYALPSLIHCLWFKRWKANKNPFKIKIHSLNETFETIESLMNIFGLYTKPNNVIIDKNKISFKDNLVVNIMSVDNYELRVFPVNHAKNLLSFGLKIIKPNGKNIVFTIDSVADQLIKSQIDPQTEKLIHDCGSGFEGNNSHGSATSINELIKGTNINETYLVHLEHNIEKSDFDRLIKITSSGYDGNVLIPNDYDIISL